MRELNKFIQQQIFIDYTPWNNFPLKKINKKINVSFIFVNLDLK